MLSYFWSVSPDNTLSGLARIFPLLVISLLIWETCRTRSQADGALQAFVLGGYVLIISLAYNFAIGAQSTDADRIAAGGFNPDDFLYLIPVPIAWYLARRPELSSRFVVWLNIGYVLLAPLGVVFTAGRAALIVALPIYAYIIWDSRKLKSSTKITFALSLLLLVALLPKLGVETKLDRLATTITNPSAGSKWGGALNGRDFLWAIAIKQFAAHPILGTGATTFSFFSADSQAVATSRGDDGEGLPAHNTYLSILSETGLIGFFLFALLFIVACRAAWLQEDRMRRNAFIAAVVAMLVGISTLTYENNIGIWLLLTLIVDSSSADRLRIRRQQAVIIHDMPGIPVKRFGSPKIGGS